MEEILTKVDSFLQWNFSTKTQETINVILIWLGFSIIVGLIARILVPGRVNRGPFATLIIGLTGSCLGPLLATTLREVENFNPIGPAGFIISILTAVVALYLFHFTMILFPPKDPEEKERKRKERRID